MQSHAFTSTSSSSTSLPHRRTPSSNRLALHQSVPSNASFPSKSIDFEAVASISGDSLRRLPSICRSSSSKLTGWISTPPPDVPENETDGVEVRAAAVTDTAGEAVNRKKSSLVSLLELGALFGFWFVFNIYFNIYNKQVLDVYPFPITLSMLQFAVGTVLVILMWTLNLHKRPKISGSQLAAIFPLALVHTLGNLTLNMSLGKVSVSFTHTIKALEPFFSVFLSAMFLGEAPTIWVVSSLVPVVGGVVLASMTEASFNWVGFWSAMASNLSNQSRNVLSKKFMVRKEDSLDNITLFSFITLMSFALNIPITLLVEGIKFTPSYMQSTGLNVSQVYNWSLLACICFHAYQQVAYMILERVSPVTHSVGNCVKRVVVIVSSVLFFRTPVSPINALGTGVALTGVFLYSRIRNIKPKQKTA